MRTAVPSSLYFSCSTSETSPENILCQPSAYNKGRDKGAKIMTSILHNYLSCTQK